VRKMLPAWSRDGKWIAFSGEFGDRSEVWLVPSDGSAPARSLTSGADARRVRWDPVSHDILASASWGTDRISLWKVSLKDGSGRRFSPQVDFGPKHESGFGSFDVSADGHLLLYARSGGAVGQVCKIEPARKGVY